jgi:CBS domain containing-hemolysin-like protein
VLTEGEAKIVLRAFEFADKCAAEIMVPAAQVDYVSLARSFEENVESPAATCTRGCRSVIPTSTRFAAW